MGWKRWINPRWLVPVITFALIIIFPSPGSGSSGTTKRALKKLILLDKNPVLPDRVRLLAECSGTNCTRTCPENYAIDSEQRYCRRKRQDICPPGYIQRSGAGGGAGCIVQDIECPPGSTREGERCVVRSFSCPVGYAQRGSSCVRDNICQPGYRWENGLCFPPGARVFCPPGYTQQGRHGPCAPIVCSDCCDCQEEEAMATVCPTGYTHQWGRCVRLLQASPELRIESVTYKLPIECRSAEATYSDGRCESWTLVGRPVCSEGHSYNGSCVEVAKCQRGTLNNVCSCEHEQHIPPSCTNGGKLHESGSCVISQVNCRPPFRLHNGVCVREVTIGSLCPADTGVPPVSGGFCSVDEPRCPRGYALDKHTGLCRKASTCTRDCGSRYQQQDQQWCGIPASCPEGYALNEHGYCVKESIHKPYNCPEGTIERNDECLSVQPLCRSPLQYHANVDQCVRCDERSAYCPRGNLTTGGLCIWSESACPEGYSWKDSMCVAQDAALTVRCKQGYAHDRLCIHGELNCPDEYELLDESCVVKNEIHCPEGSYPIEGLCVVERECPDQYHAGSEGCVREVRRPINVSQPNCPPGFSFGAEGEGCLRRTVIDATIKRQHRKECPEGYERRMTDGWCVRAITSFPICPPQTIYTDRNDRCYCEVDLGCPTGYERTGADCTYRGVGFTGYLHFLIPCYGALCGAQHCLSHCSSPPCPIEPCSGANHAPVRTPGSWANGCLGSGTGGENCPPQEVLGLVCPPGYERVNSTCVTYYDKVCPVGYNLTTNGECQREILLEPSCPPGYSHSSEPASGHCEHASCPEGYKLTGIGKTCEKRELRSPKPCPPGHDYYRGVCYRRSHCRNGTVDGAFCVERAFANPICPQGFVLRENDCATEGTCPSGSTYIDGSCLRLAQPASCPEGTYRWGRLCVYPEAPECDRLPHVQTSCSSEVDQHGRCWHRVAPSCPQGYRLRDGRCVVCQTEQPNCQAPMAIRGENCVAERIVCPEGHFLRGNVCILLHIALPRCPSGEFGLCRGFCIAPHTPDCEAAIEYTLPTCNRGLLYQGRCVEHARCDPESTLIDNECRLRTFTDTSCHGKGTKIGEQCVGGLPQCPASYALTNGRCYSCAIENAQCSSGGGGGTLCKDSFCHLEEARCSASGSFFFDGYGCRELTTTEATCPPGTSPDRHDRHFCQLQSEKASYICPPEYYYQQGVCLKKLYSQPSCPPGDYKLRHGVCLRRSCTRMSSGVTCASGTDTTAISCAQCMNSTIGGARGKTATSLTNTNNALDLCCAVFSPRICQLGNRCYHERETVCGSFCLTEDDRIYLTVPDITWIGGQLYMAPRKMDGDEDGDEGDEDTEGSTPEPESSSAYVRDCIQCRLRLGRCPKVCDTYDCQTEGDGECNFKDARKFCWQHDSVNLCKRFKREY
ncbi:zonadhesin-like [Anopheles aquasalis]|uniref:zonadhesin-like n=1 Tax=Anopheles aquasalis TaxID=42839 RepID=UPI00215B3332|nr:zonadhesin-like [Anopheles aquasalis]